MNDNSGQNEFKDSLNLPRTEFPIRAQFSIFDAQVLQRWIDEKLSEASFYHNKGKEKFILHDGPPYSNGDIHLGHAFNKILKDIFSKYERMTGKHVPIIPGWDCHGLPIELKVAEQNPGLVGAELKKACRAYALDWVNVQRESFKKLGVLMHWDKPYLTMDYSYEAAIVRAFGAFFRQGYIQRQLKTVPWCASCKTVLAQAEIEYEDRKDPSIYVEFPLAYDVAKALFPSIDGQVSLLIWTTTPWTLPLNRAVVLKPGAFYQVVKMKDKYVVLAKDLVEKVAKTVSSDAEILATFPAEDLIGKKVGHPFVDGLFVPILGDGFTSLEDGTACVHSAPGCGPVDYEIGVKNGLEIYSPISQSGTYTQDIEPKELSGMSVVDGQIWVIKKLAQVDRLFFKSSIRHSYPHCWRCHQGLIFRATSQWFCDLSKHNLKDRALESINDLCMLPEWGKNRFSSTLEGRLEWCLSRQRTWGVVIPALRCTSCDHVQTDTTLIEKAAQGIEQHGIEYWDDVSVVELGSFVCQKCGSNQLAKEKDIIDVWFESGVSHYAVLYGNDEQAYPADMYLEGKDQHRAWFQSSLLTSLVLEKKPCMKSIVTHGFTVDEKGRKMSKSLGNVVTPFEIIDKIGIDGLRLWVASNDYDSDPIVSETLIKNVAEVYRKIRNTCRFLLSNLYDFDISKDAVSVSDMLAIDQYALLRLHHFNVSILSCYRDRKTTAVFHEFADYCVKDLSSFYLDIIKDRLYVEKADGRLRRSAQTVCYYILDVLTKNMAPILSCTAELISDHYQVNKKKSIHLQDFIHLGSMLDEICKHYQVSMHKISLDVCEQDFVVMWDELLKIRNAVLKALEVLRSKEVIKHSLDAQVNIHITQAFSGFGHVKHLYHLLGDQSVEQFFKEYFIVSQVTLHHDLIDDMYESLPGVFVKVDKAVGEKCTRCWQWSIYISNQLCERCNRVLERKST